MKKHLIITLVAVLLICVSLSGCFDIGLTNIGDIQANPEEYLGKEVKVKGYAMISMVSDDAGHGIMIKTDRMLSGMYYLTGIIKYGEESSGVYYGQYYLEVTKAEGA